jgi:mono/diheme cytochrome c family protein
VYNVHIKHFNKSIFTGRLTREEMLEEHPLELARIEAGEDAPPPARVVRRRRRLYLPVSTLFTVVALFLVYAFVTLETTAIETVPPQPTQVVFQRAIPPVTPSPAPIAERTGASIPHSLARHENCVRCHAIGTLRPFPDDHIGYGNERCLECHAPLPEASQQVVLAGENVPSFQTQIKPALEENCVVCHGVAGGLNLTGYNWLMAGGNAGQVVVPGQPEQSLVVRVLEAGHFADLPAETQTALEEWILVGAPNN